MKWLARKQAGKKKKKNKARGRDDKMGKIVERKEKKRRRNKEADESDKMGKSRER